MLTVYCHWRRYSPYMLLYLLNTGLNQLDEWYYLMWITTTSISCTFYTDMHWFYYWFYIKWINHHVVIITMIPSTHHRSTNSTAYANSTSKLDMVLMIDTDVIWFNKKGSCGIILETWILLWGAFFDLLGGGFVKDVLNGFHIYWTWSWSVG
jgi:hypothetical protein